MALFLSTFINKVDRKGRVSVPAPFRAAVADQSFKGIVAFRSYREAAIEACAIDRMERLSESVDALDQFSEEQDDFASTIFADAHQLPIDGDGRIILPSALVEHAGITDAAAFVGRGGTFQIWDPQAFERHQAEARTRVGRRAATLRLAPRGGSQ
ncbi:MAG: division/cell wall cluster transcriptional repressor MraZ [Alphaproteobacteria bacterium]|nr:division/cell wall cluster transcriptional repressor MraZ [Alphaproteobacteria bacterium]